MKTNKRQQQTEAEIEILKKMFPEGTIISNENIVPQCKIRFMIMKRSTFTRTSDDIYTVYGSTSVIHGHSTGQSAGSFTIKQSGRYAEVVSHGISYELDKIREIIYKD